MRGTIMAKRNTREEIQKYFGYSDTVMAQWWDNAPDADREFFEALNLSDDDPRIEWP
jgi:hypothetical protein